MATVAAITTSSRSESGVCIVIGCDRAYFEAGAIATDVVDHDEPIVPDFPEDKYRDDLTKAVGTVFDEIDEPDTSAMDGSIEWDIDDAAVTTGDTTVEGVDDRQPLPATVERLATAEPTNALQEGMLESYRQIGATGYVRGLDADPCERCEKWWYRGGYVWPIDKFWNWHPYCQCYPIPVFGTNEGDEKK